MARASGRRRRPLAARDFTMIPAPLVMPIGMSIAGSK